MNEKKFPIWVAASLALTTLFSGFSLYKRHQVESENRAVGIAVEYQTIQTLAHGAGLTTLEGMKRLKGAGLGYVVLGEDSLGELLSDQSVQFRYPDRLYGDPQRLKQVNTGLLRRYPGLSRLEGNEIIFSRELSLSSLRSVGVGLDPQAVGEIKNSGLRMVARFGNPEGVTPNYVSQVLSSMKESGAEVFLPQGDQVLGRRDALGALVDGLKANDLYYATPEFNKIGGDANVTEKVPERVLRLHSAQAAELDKLPYSEAVDRYVKAGRERNQRLLLVRSVSFAGDEPLLGMSKFIQDIAKKLVHDGSTLGRAHPFRQPSMPSWAFVLIGISLAPLLAFVATTLVPKIPLNLALAVSLLIGAATFISPGRSFVALFGALATPIVAYIWLMRKGTSSPILNFLVMSLITWAGGLSAAGLLNALPYYIQVKQFMGVKAAVFLPVVLVGGYLLRELGNWKKSLTTALTWQQMGLAFLVLAALGILVARTGNDNPATVSGLELQFRAILDSVLFVRPRTKEFLLGHPALIVGLFMLARWNRGGMAPSYLGWTILMLMVGAIGQTGLLNTMCHTHTPVLISMARNLVGMVAGGILGCAIWLVVKRWNPVEVETSVA